MSPILLTVLATALLSAGPDAPRKPNPLAPSLPQLTEEEEEKLDALIDRFIAADICQLAGAEARKALRDFDRLGPEAIPALIRGLNRAARIEGSCPAVLIAKKLSRMLAATDDRELLEYARENIGAGVGRTRHAAVLQDLRVACMLRKGMLARRGTTVLTPAAVDSPSLRRRTVNELAQAAGSERGPLLKAVLRELERRHGDEAVAALGTAAASYESDIQELARSLLLKNLSREGPAVIQNKLKDERAEVRAAAARVAGSRGFHFEVELIDRLTDEHEGVRQAAHDALVQLSRGIDHGPAGGAGKTERDDAVRKWRAWLETREKKKP